MFQTPKRIFVRNLTLLLTTLVWAADLSAQEPLQKPISGLQQTIPLTPSVAPRQLATPIELRDLTKRTETDQQTTGSFIQSLQGEDALIEVVVGRGRLLTFEDPLIKPDGTNIPAIAVGDPTVLDFDLLPNSRMIRLLGKRVGVTDLSIVTANGKSLSFQVQVTYDMDLLRAQLRQIFPDANLRLAQMYEHVVIEGQAASVDQVEQIIKTVQAYLTSVQIAKNVSSKSERDPDEVPVARALPNAPSGDEEGGDESPQGGTPALDEEKPDISATIPAAQIINLIRVPGVQQVMLQVRIAELSRTGLRNVGADILYRDSSGRTFGSRIGTAGTRTDMDTGDLLGLALGQTTTAFAIIPNATLDVFLQVLRSNQIIKILAEPNLMALHGQQASFLAGGEFPVPVPQIAGNTSAITIQFKEFGVLLNFIPYILEGDMIRLQVAPEVSTIDPTVGIVAQGIEVPGVNTRRANTTVELRQGQTLALAGLMQVEVEARTDRLPGLGDLPYIGPMFSNTSDQKEEKELIILVTPWLVDAMEECQVAPLPGSEVTDPDDFEFYWLNRIEGRSNCNDYRATLSWDDPLNFKGLHHHEKKHVQGPYGFSK